MLGVALAVAATGGIVAAPWLDAAALAIAGVVVLAGRVPTRVQVVDWLGVA